MEFKVRKLKIYSESFKQKVVSEAKLGMSLSALSAKYGIFGSTTVSRWCKQYGVMVSHFEYVDVPLEEINSLKSLEKMPKENSPKREKNESKTLADKIKLLEYELLLYKKLVEIAKRDYNLDLVKKLDTKPSKM
jgi:transposase